MEGGKTVSRSARSTFHLPPSTDAKRWHEVPPADGVRVVGDSPSFAANPFGGIASKGGPDFSVRYGRAKLVKIF